jgi:hypothetical protein
VVAGKILALIQLRPKSRNDVQRYVDADR